jgi:hypothetical protein
MPVSLARRSLAERLQGSSGWVNVGLSGVETIGAFFRVRLEPRLRQIPSEHRNDAPKLNVVGPAVELVRFTSEDDELQDLFANLIARAMDKRVAARAHPAFVRIINELTSDEGEDPTCYRARPAGTDGQYRPSFSERQGRAD